MKKYSLLHPYYLSFYSKSLYQDVASQWRGTGFLYLFILLAIAWIPLIIKYQVSISEFVDVQAPKVTQQLPTIKIKQGQLSLDAEGPVIVRDPESNEMIAILDTSGEITSLDD